MMEINFVTFYLQYVHQFKFWGFVIKVCIYTLDKQDPV